MDFILKRLNTVVSYTVVCFYCFFFISNQHSPFIWFSIPIIQCFPILTPNAFLDWKIKSSEFYKSFAKVEMKLNKGLDSLQPLRPHWKNSRKHLHKTKYSGDLYLAETECCSQYSCFSDKSLIQAADPLKQ